MYKPLKAVSKQGTDCDMCETVLLYYLPNPVGVKGMYLVKKLKKLVDGVVMSVCRRINTSAIEAQEIRRGRSDSLQL